MQTFDPVVNQRAAFLEWRFPYITQTDRLRREVAEKWVEDEADEREAYGIATDAELINDVAISLKAAQARICEGSGAEAHWVLGNAFVALARLAERQARL